MDTNDEEEEWGSNYNEIPWKYVSSSNIRAIAYNKKSLSLFVEFHSGGVYEYLNVPYWVFSDFKTSSSKGKFFHWRVKDKFAWVKVR